MGWCYKIHMGRAATFGSGVSPTRPEAGRPLTARRLHAACVTSGPKMGSSVPHNAFITYHEASREPSLLCSKPEELTVHTLGHLVCHGLI